MAASTGPRTSSATTSPSACDRKTPADRFWDNVSPESRRYLKSLELDDIVVLGNTEEDEVRDIMVAADATISDAAFDEVLSLRDKAAAMCDDEIRRESKGLVSSLREPVPESSPQPTLAALVRKPLKLPQKRPCVVPRIPLRGPEGNTVGDSERAAQSRLREVADVLWARFVELGKSGAAWTENLATQNFCLEAQATLTEDWAGCPTLERHVATLEAWIQWSEDRGQAWQTPDSIGVRVFLNSFKENGTSVPRRHFDSLKWLQTNIGLRACTELERVRRLTDPPSSHEPVQARPVLPTVWIMLENALSSGNMFVKGLALFAIFSIISVSRPKHMQRSVLLGMSHRIEARVTKGKQKVKGRASPYFWAAPRVGITGIDLGEHLDEFLKSSGASTPETPFFLPDFAPKRSDFASATGFSRMPMSPQKIARQLLVLLRSLGISEDIIAATDVLYCFRRLFPTLAHRSSFEDQEALDVGGWNDPVAKQRNAMPRLYSSAKLEMQYRRKAELVSTARLAIRNSFLAKGPSAPTWEQLFQCWPTRSEAQDLMTRPLASSSIKRILPQAPSVHDEVAASESGSASSAPSSDSDASDGGDAEDEAYPPELAKLEWQLSSGSKGCLHLVVKGQLVCGRVLRRPELGRGLSEATSAGRPWSPRCKAKLPVSALQWLDS